MNPKLNAQCAERKAARGKLRIDVRKTDKRRQTIARLIHEGATNAQLAKYFCVAESTAKHYRWRVWKELNPNRCGHCGALKPTKDELLL